METYRSTYAIDISNGNEIKFPVRKFRGTFEDVLMRSAATAEVKAEDMDVMPVSHKGTQRHTSRTDRSRHLRDNTPKYKEWKKEKKANRELARERRGEQRWRYRDLEHGNLEVVPLYYKKESCVRKSFTERKAKEVLKEALSDTTDYKEEFRKEEEMRLAYEKRQDAFDRFAELEDKILKLEEQKRHLEQLIADLRYEQSQITF